jgi:hypothetical protein
MRNGFSHAYSGDILADLPDETKAFKGSLSDPEAKLTAFSLNQKIIPWSQALQMERFAKDNAKTYFDFVFQLIFKIEKRLIEKLK